jgi:hypothetical protein
MMQGMMNCGMGGWFGGIMMMGGGLLVLILLVLSIVALAKYVFWGGRDARPGTP